MEPESNATESLNTEGSTAKDLIMPFKILIMPVRAFSQLSQRAAAKGLITLAALIVTIAALAQYVSATKIVLTINGQPSSFMATAGFTTWLAGTLSTTVISIMMYWLVFSAGLALISRFVSGKETKLTNSFVILGYMLSVFFVLYAVRTVMYLALPSISFQLGSWPPTEPAQIDEALSLITQTWGSLPIFQFERFFSYVSFAWLVLLGAIAVKTMREISWSKAGVISSAVFVFTLFLLGLP